MCYGDLGILLSLYVACHYKNRMNLKEECLNMLISCSKRRLNYETTYDGSIIYGASGLFILFDQLNHWNPRTEFQEARQYWLNNILKFRKKKKNSYLGFKNMFDDYGDKINLSFGWGLIGIAMSLMRGYNEKLPQFDELTMV